MTIRFGTDGWRAVISEDWTFDNVRLVAQAIADEFLALAQPDQIPVAVIGFDTRFLSDRYAITVSNVFAANGLAVYLSKADCPTPALSFAVKQYAAVGGVMITASHNPPRYNGIKVKASFGGSALPAMMERIEHRIQALEVSGQVPAYAEPPWQEDHAAQPGDVVRFDPLPAYLQHLRTLIDFAAIAQSGLRVAVDPMYGAGRGYIARWLRELGVMVAEIHGELNPGFGGLHPEPIGRNLEPLANLINEGSYDLGLATDGDADRIGAMDSSGRFVSPHMIMGLILQHLVERKHQRGMVVKTISTTQLLNRLAATYDLRIEETPVGFNHICDWMLSEAVLVGGEESGGISILGHIPEGDGILIGLLLLEIVAQAKKPLHDLVQALQDQYGPFFYDRIDQQVQPFSKAELVEFLRHNAPDMLAGEKVDCVNDRDGVKYVMADQSWLLIRPSGTEPVLRIYAEARTESQVADLLEAGVHLAEQHLHALSAG